MKSVLKKVIACVLMLAMVLSMAACGNGDDGSASSHTDGQVVVNIDWPAYIDPGVANKDADLMAIVNLYDSLVFPNTDGTVSPLVAETWEANDYCTVYTFHLREDVVFHSGNPLTAKDVKWSMDRLLGMGEGMAYLYTGVVDSVEVVDDYTVQFNLAAPSGTFPSALTRLYIMDSALVTENIDTSSTQYGENGDYGKGWLNTNDAGSGPYKVKEIRTEEYIIMEQSDNYWQEFDEKAPNRRCSDS